MSFNFRYFEAINPDGTALVRWTDGTTTTEPLAELRGDLLYRDVDPFTIKEWAMLCSRADRPNDAMSVRHRKRQERETAYAHNASGKRQKTNLMQHCQWCGFLSPGDVCGFPCCTTFVCEHCQQGRPQAEWQFCHLHSGPTPVLSTKVARHGCPRLEAVRVRFVCEDPHFAETCSSRVEEVVTGPGADVVVFSFHSTDHDDHFEHLFKGINGDSPSFVLVLTCWTDATAQTAALRRLALHHPSTTFVTFREPRLNRFDKFDIAMPLLADSVLYPKSQPLVFLSFLCAHLPDAVLFAACGMPEEKPEACGPFVVAEGGQVQPRCGVCREVFSNKERGKWKRGLAGVRRRKCRRTQHCADLLVSSRPLTSAAGHPTHAVGGR